jgi:hypothetical protein
MNAKRFANFKTLFSPKKIPRIDMPDFNTLIFSRVGTKVFAFVFSRKFSRNSLFVFAKDSLRKDETFAKVFAKTKVLIS